ncbi:hypothetical protein [Arenicella sp. 4NH20-0111]|uniref:hypothetical protein n=1 Tax=Arenicella sp. 4NH20-0111 TaxID=3127648 RepID=UPI003340E5B0
MNIKHLIITLVILFSCVVHAGGEDGTTNVQPDDGYLLMKSYLESELTEYKNFDDFYTVMLHLNLPNLNTSDPYLIEAQLDFSNPQSLSKYRALMDRKNEEYVHNAKYAPKSAAELSAERNKRDIKDKVTAEFKKEGYFDFLKEALDSDPTKMVRICINADYVAVGLRNNQLSYREFRAKVNDSISLAIAKLREQTYSDLEFRKRPVIPDCDATLKVSMEALERLNKDPLIGSFGNPERVRELTLTYKNSP